MVDGRGLFDDILARGAVFEATTDTAWLQALLDAEAALAHALVDTGRVPAEAAAAISAQCRSDRFDIAVIGREAAKGGNPVIPLVEMLRAAVGPPAAEYVHAGATSQDIMDTAAMLVLRRSFAVLQADVADTGGRAADLATAYRSAPMAGRTLLQQAVPTTFGLLAGTWLLGLDAARRRLAEVATTRLAVQLGGAAGTLAGYGAGAIAVLDRFAERVGLPAPVAPWHTERSRMADVAGALAVTAAAAGKAALDVVLLAQTEVGEVTERQPGAGGSSSMPHKHNPIAAISARAAAAQAPALLATLLAASAQELQRGAGPWHAEWLPLRSLLRSTGSAVSWLGESLRRLEVDTARMAEHAGDRPDVGAAPELVDRIVAHWHNGRS